MLSPVWGLGFRAYGLGCTEGLKGVRTTLSPACAAYVPATHVVHDVAPELSTLDIPHMASQVSEAMDLWDIGHIWDIVIYPGPLGIDAN